MLIWNNKVKESPKVVADVEVAESASKEKNIDVHI